MPLSISKLQDLLATKGFIPNKYFILDDLVFYIELVSVHNASTFLLYIPSKYEFAPMRGMDAFKIRYIDMENSENTADEYADAGNKDNLDVESAYDGATIDLSPDKNEKIEEHLEDHYKRPISLKDISAEDSTDLKSIYRQMRRLRYCVQNIKYKVGIMYKNYICAIRRDDSIDCFNIKHYPRTKGKQLMVIVDLEMFYEKNEKLMSDIETVRTGIYNILQKNQGLHSQVIGKLLESKEEISTVSEKTKQKKSKYDSHLSTLENMLRTMNNAEKKTVTELYELNENRNDKGGMHSDIENAHKRGRLDAELAKISKIKEEIMKTMTALRKRREDSILSVDKIMFDNTVMFDCIIKNFTQLRNFHE